MTNKKAQKCVASKPKPGPPFPVDCEKAHIREAEVFEVFNHALQYYKPGEFCLAFNGGKDCTVLLHMLVKYYRQNCLEHLRVPVLFIIMENSFEEVDAFVEECAKTYNLEMIKRCGNIKDALWDVCEKMPYLKAVFMGCRRLDPFCSNMSILQATDDGWPPMMRISPILNWTCRDVWNYIFACNVPYCRLYDEGYTSLGNKLNTKPNQHLKVVHPQTGEISYRAAYELADDDLLERAGRV